MKVRDDVLVSADDMGTSGTKIYNLDYTDPISSIELLIAATNGATDNKNNPIERNISKIEIVDGSDELWSLPGDVAYSLFSQLNGAPANEYHSAATSDTPYVVIPILFGRKLYDPTLSFLPRNFKNPQLKVTFNEATVRAAGGTGFVSDSFTLTIVAHLMEEAAASEGWLMSKMIEEYTSLASGDHETEMPTDYPYRLIMVRAYEAGTALDATITNYKLNCDGGKFKPFDCATGRLIDRMTKFWRPTYKAGYESADNGDVVQTWVGVDMGQAIHPHTAGWIINASSFYPGQFTVGVTSHAGAAGSDIAVHWLVHGWCPHNLLVIPFGSLDEKGEWFQAPSYRSVKLYQTQGNAGAEVNVCVQQLRPY